MSPASAKIASVLVATFQAGGKLLICGNGGSAADSMHIAAEFVGRFQLDRSPLAAIALTADTATLTAIANDYGYVEVFSRQIAALGKPGDVLLALSTSGRSPNIARAVLVARGLGLRTIVLTGEGGRDLAAMADYSVVYNAVHADAVQECYMRTAHAVCGRVERACFPDAPLACTPATGPDTAGTSAQADGPGDGPVASDADQAMG